MDKCTKCRKFGAKLFLKGARCMSPKCAYTRRNAQPASGARQKTRPVRKSEYGLQLVEKQKAKAEYGLREKQFSKIFGNAAKSGKTTGEELLRLLEMRIDNTIYRLGWAASRAQARQLVLHRKIKLNNKVVNIPSILLKTGDKIAPINEKVISPEKTNVPVWLKLDQKNKVAQVSANALKQDIETDLDDQLIIEFYSR